MTRVTKGETSAERDDARALVNTPTARRAQPEAGEAGEVLLVWSTWSAPLPASHRNSR
jgi:hypothetical protein